jgi:UDP-glucose 6-dehydrogenase
MGFILIAGFGNVGKHIKNEFADAEIYDKFREEYKQLKNEKYDFCFVCVPTEFVNGKIETSAVENVLQEVDAEIYIIKSAVPIGFCSSVENKNIVYSPEFWGNTQHAKQEPDFLILSGSRTNTEKVAILYYTIKMDILKFDLLISKQLSL